MKKVLFDYWYPYQLHVVIEPSRVFALHEFLSVKRFKRKALPYIEFMSMRDDHILVRMNQRVEQAEKDEFEAMVSEFIEKGYSDILGAHMKKLTKFLPSQPEKVRASWHD